MGISTKIGKEHERKYRLVDPPLPSSLLTAQSVAITQYYLNTMDVLAGIGVNGKRSPILVYHGEGEKPVEISLPRWAKSQLKTAKNALRHRREKQIRGTQLSHSCTVKGSGRISRNECDKEIPSWVFDAFYSRRVSHREISKDRHFIKENGVLLEVNYFSGHLSGLVIVEVEFASEQDALSYPGPQRFGPWIDVTFEPQHFHRALLIADSPPVIFGPHVDAWRNIGVDSAADKTKLSQTGTS